MNARFTNYLQTLTPKKRVLAKEAIAEYLKGESEETEKIDSALKAYNLCRDLSLESEEHAVVLLLKHSFKLIKRIEIAKGGITETMFDTRVILREALMNNATVVIMVHNHPSGSVTPSKFDNELTKNAKKACDIMRIHLADHVIIGDGAYYSYREQGEL